MAAGTVKIVTDADGGYYLVGTVDGLTVTFATVNGSQVAEAKAAGKVVPVQHDADEPAEGEG